MDLAIQKQIPTLRNTANNIMFQFPTCTTVQVVVWLAVLTSSPHQTHSFIGYMILADALNEYNGFQLCSRTTSTEFLCIVIGDIYCFYECLQ